MYQVLRLLLLAGKKSESPSGLAVADDHFEWLWSLEADTLDRTCVLKKALLKR